MPRGRLETEFRRNLHDDRLLFLNFWIESDSEARRMEEDAGDAEEDKAIALKASSWAEGGGGAS